MSESENSLAFSTKLFQSVKRFSFLMKMRVLFYFFDSVILFFLKRPKQSHGKKRRICILLLPGMGDCIIFCRLAESLKKALPSDQYDLTILSNDTHEKLLSLFFDHVIGLPFYKMSFNPFTRIHVLLKLRKLSFDELWDLNGCGECTPNIFISNAIDAATKKVAYPGLLDYGKCKNICPEWMKRKIFLETIEMPNKIHLLTMFQIFLQHVSGQKILPGKLIFPMQKPSGVPDEYLIFVPAGSQQRNLWGKKKFSDLGAKLFAKRVLPIIICGSSRDRSYCTFIERQLNTKNTPVINMTGKTSFEELVWLISHAREVFTIDTGTFHLSIATGTKTTVIASDAVFSLYINYPESIVGGNLTIYHSDPDCRNCGNNCYQQNLESYPCLNEITVDDLIDDNDFSENKK